jgi:micrococcal nuclease
MASMVMAMASDAKRSRGPLAGRLALVIALLTLGGPAQAGTPPDLQRTRVTRVIDGDTVEARWGGEVRDVRLIGVDTPETVDPDQDVQCYGPEASAFTERKLEGKRVHLEFDEELEDRYGRTLAYVWIHDRLFNKTLVARGFARVTIYPPNDKYQRRLERAEDAAREAGRGLWGECKNEGGGGGDEECDPSYPTVCIPSPPPDLDCADVPFTNFEVLPPDPHGFDGDGDGIGCET